MTDHIRRVPAPRGEAAPDPGSYRQRGNGDMRPSSYHAVQRELCRLQRASGEVRFDVCTGKSGRPFVRIQFWRRDGRGALVPGGHWTAVHIDELPELSRLFEDVARDSRRAP